MDGTEETLLQNLLERGVVTRAHVEVCARDCGPGAGPRAIIEALAARGFLDSVELQGLSLATRVAGDADAPTVRTGDAPRRDADRSTITAQVGPTAPRSPAARSRRLGPFEILDELGRGGMGVVYRALDTRLGRTVALKVLEGHRGCDPALVARFQHEAATLAKLRHPGIVVIHEAGEIDGEPYLVMECLPGSTLRARMPTGRPLDPREGARLLLQVAEALAAAHAHGIVHRDVKPENILFREDGCAVLSDFGLARETDGRARLTATGAIVGTPAYMAPEQAAPSGSPPGPPTDVYALGAVLYEWTTGLPPHTGGSLAELVRKVAEEEARPARAIVESLPRDLETVCIRCLEKDPARRYRDAAALAEDLRRFLDGEPIEARRSALLARLLRRARRRWTVVLPCAAAVVLAVGFGVQSWASWRRRTLALEQAHAAARVLLRAGSLRDAFAELERDGWDERATGEERRERSRVAWSRVQAFVDQTPADAASRSTVRAVQGWAQWLGGDPEKGDAWMDEATRIDPDLPFGALFRAFSRLSTWLWARAWLRSLTGPDGVLLLPPPAEVPEEKGLRDRVDVLLSASAGAAVWGEEEAGDFREALDALSRLQHQEYAEADRRLTRLIDSGDLPFLGTDLRYARAHALFALGRYAEALPDVDAVVAARPGGSRGYALRGDLRLALLHDGPSRPDEEALASLALAREDLSRASELAPQDDEARYDLLRALLEGAQAEALAGRDATGTLDRVSRVIREFPSANAPELINARGIASYVEGRVLAARGEDPRPSFDRARKELDRVRGTGELRGMDAFNRAQTELQWGIAEANRGGDPAPHWKSAVDEIGALPRGGMDDPAALVDRGVARVRLGEWERDHGRDGVPLLEAALSDFARAEGISPDRPAPYANEAITQFDLGHWEAALAASEKAATRYGPRVPPDARVVRLHAGVALAYEDLGKGDYARARERYERAIAAAGEDLGSLLEGRASLRAAHYNLACIEAVQSTGRASPSSEARPLAEAEATRLREEAFRHLDAAVGLGFEDAKGFADDADLATLRSDPRWQRALDAIRAATGREKDRR